MVHPGQCKKRDAASGGNDYHRRMDPTFLAFCDTGTLATMELQNVCLFSGDLFTEASDLLSITNNFALLFVGAGRLPKH